jgi:hypothetical protein
VERKVQTTCLECGKTITLDFGDLDYAEAKQWIEKMDSTPRECPGFHVEIGGWKRLWQLEDSLERAYTDEEKAGVIHKRVSE